MLKKYENKIYYFIVLFFIGAVLGKIIETSYYLYVTHKLTNTGSMFGPWIRIYGYGMVLLYILKRFKKNPFIIFILSMFLAGSLELFSGIFIDKVMHMKLWDYGNEILSIHGYVCLKSLLLFGCAGMFLHYVIIPSLDKLFESVNIKYIKYICWVLITLFLADFILSKFFKVLYLF